jgi:hypothetical protein
MSIVPIWWQHAAYFILGWYLGLVTMDLAISRWGKRSSK